MSKSNWIVFDGDLKPAEEKIISAESRGLMYGDGCFETFRSYKGRFFEVEKHLARLEEGLQYLGIRYPEMLKHTTCKDLFYKLSKCNNLLDKDALIRVQVWRKGERGYQTEAQSQAHFCAIARTLPSDAAKPIVLSIVNTRRIPNQAIPSRFKLSNGINYIKAASEAKDKDADDALMLTVDGVIAETTIANIFWVKGAVIHSPSADCDLLPGITRNGLLQVIRNLTEYRVAEGKFSPEELQNADAVWVCNSVRELVPVRRIDNQEYPTQHPVFKELRQKFTAYRNQKLVTIQ